MIRAFWLWCAIIPLAIANGLLRDLALVPMLGPVMARAASGLILSAAIFTWTWIALRWLHRRRAAWYAAMGAAWLGLTVVFEFTFGKLVAGHTWEEMLRPYRFEGGDLWPLVLVVVSLSPIVAARVRGLA